MRGPRNTGHALASEHQGEKHNQLLGDREVDPCSLGHEDGGNREVERGPVEIERITQRHHEAYDALGHSEGGESFHRIRHGGVGGGGSEGQKDGFAEFSEESSHRHPGPERHRQQDRDGEDGQRQVERSDEFGQIGQHPEAAVTDRVGHGRADANGSELHNHPGELEHHFGERLAEVEHGLALGFGCLSQCDSKENREEDHLKHIVGGCRLKETFRHDVFEDAAEGDLGGRDTGVC